jgi:Zn-finger nucleic acid-binding protein
MQSVPDIEKKIEADLCTNCAFSWLDADDIATLTFRKKWGLPGFGR